MQSVATAELVIPVLGGCINADLAVPAHASGLVILPLSGSTGRGAACNDDVARTMHESGMATLTVHLLRPVEAASEAGRGVTPDRSVLLDRLLCARQYLETNDLAKTLPVALCGVAGEVELTLWAAAHAQDAVRAVATLGGRPDQVPGDVIARIRPPTMLVIGNLDSYVIEATRAAARELRPAHRVAIVPGAMHSFARSESTENAALRAALWFRRHLGARTYRPPIAEEACVE